MTTRCSVCDHERRDEIEAQLRAGMSLRLVSRATGISKDALHRHQKNHNSLGLRKAVAERTEGTEEETSDLGDLRSSLLLMLEVAMSKGDFIRATGLARELRQTLAEIEKVEAARALRDGGPSEKKLRVVYDLDVEIEELLKDYREVFDLSALTDDERGVFERLLQKVRARSGVRSEETFDSIAALDTEIRRLEAELGNQEPIFDLSRLSPDDLAELERILSKALNSDAVETEPITRELPETSGDERSGQDNIEAESPEPEPARAALSASEGESEEES